MSSGTCPLKKLVAPVEFGGVRRAIDTAQGLELASENRERLAERMSPSQIEKAQRLARERKPKKEGK